MHRYCTLFDRNYLPRGLALYRSLARHGGDFRLHVLCLDAETRAALDALSVPRLELVSIADLERSDPRLARVRGSRTPPEYYFTCKPVLLAYLLARFGDVERLTYLDSDLYFFSQAAEAEREYAGSSIALAPHKFGSRNAHKAQFGKFNAGWISVGRGAESRRFLEWWGERCIEWCSLTVEETRFGDQKYLEQVPALFPDAKVVLHPGINTGPWSIDPGKVQLQGNDVLIEGRPLVFFHFHGMQRMLFSLYDSGLHEYGVELTSSIRRGIYKPYLSELVRCERDLGGSSGSGSSGAGPVRRLAQTLRALARHTAVFAAG